MKNYVLTNTKDSKKEYKKIIKSTANAIVKSINSEKSYAGPTPQELKEIVKQESILPETGLGYEKTFEKVTGAFFPSNVLRLYAKNQDRCHKNDIPIR